MTASGPGSHHGADHRVQAVRDSATYVLPVWARRRRLVAAWLRWQWFNATAPRPQRVLCRCGGFHRHDGSWRVDCPVLLRTYDWTELPPQEGP